MNIKCYCLKNKYDAYNDIDVKKSSLVNLGFYKCFDVVIQSDIQGSDHSFSIFDYLLISKQSLNISV